MYNSVINWSTVVLQRCPGLHISFSRCKMFVWYRPQQKSFFSCENWNCDAKIIIPTNSESYRKLQYLSKYSQYCFYPIIQPYCRVDWHQEALTVGKARCRRSPGSRWKQTRMETGQRRWGYSRGGGASTHATTTPSSGKFAVRSACTGCRSTSSSCLESWKGMLSRDGPIRFFGTDTDHRSPKASLIRLPIRTDRSHGTILIFFYSFFSPH